MRSALLFFPPPNLDHKNKTENKSSITSVESNHGLQEYHLLDHLDRSSLLHCMAGCLVLFVVLDYSSGTSFSFFVSAVDSHPLLVLLLADQNTSYSPTVSFSFLLLFSHLKPSLVLSSKSTTFWRRSLLGHGIWEMPL